MIAGDRDASTPRRLFTAQSTGVVECAPVTVIHNDQFIHTCGDIIVICWGHIHLRIYTFVTYCIRVTHNYCYDPFIFIPGARFKSATTF
jgi:hypothetical protein